MPHSRLSGTAKGHLLALLTVLFWGTTFISSTVLLRSFSPVEILFFRMALAIAALLIARPRRIVLKERRHEWLFAGAGLCGVTLYFLLENLALTYTYSANASVIVSTAPFFVAIASRLFLKEERLSRWFFAGFAVAMAGIVLVAFSGQQLHLNPLGDLLCVLAAISWACYSVFIRRIDQLGYDTLLTTRHVFAYGLLFLLPVMAIFGFAPPLDKLLQPVNLLNLLFLGLGASALCFVLWNTAVRELGPVRTSAYIYLSPAITIVASWLLLGDPIQPMAILGAVLTLVGLVLSQRTGTRETRGTRGTPGGGFSKRNP
ncbi:MAG: DMT family transporter [Eubacteriales bacterium]|nr:DMT family transporter [Eubacteriales bacterium]